MGLIAEKSPIYVFPLTQYTVVAFYILNSANYTRPSAQGFGEGKGGQTQARFQEPLTFIDIIYLTGIFGECLEVNSKNEIQVSAGIGGVITSPQYPQHYPGNIDCVWNITATAGKRLKFAFLGTFDLERGKDYVEIRDGSTNTSFLLGQFSEVKPTKLVYTSGPQAFVRFKTDQYFSYKGFYLMYETVKQGE